MKLVSGNMRASLNSAKKQHLTEYTKYEALPTLLYQSSKVFMRACITRNGQLLTTCPPPCTTIRVSL